MDPQALEGLETRRLLEVAVGRLAEAGVETARLDAEVLMAEAAGTSRARIVCESAILDSLALARFRAMVARRAGREPLAYILGRKEFFSLDFEVGPAVLTPRPETEVLVEAALELARGRSSLAVLDIGTGSGAVAVALAVNAPKARVVATDVSAEALSVARRNAERHGCAGRIEFRVGDCWEALEGARQAGPFDLVVSNPPYVTDAEFDSLAPEVRCFEPRLALAGGRLGLDFHARIARGLAGHLKPQGAVIVEFGDGQAQAVAAILRGAGLAEGRVVNDLAGRPRVLVAHR